jgi:DNA-binding response OmpR family regulator
MAENNFDLALLDIMLPGINGYELMEYARTLGLPVIFITAMDKVDDKVKGLRSGAEDYIAKPFEIAELLARVETVLRRYNKGEKVLKVLDIEVDIQSRTVVQNGQQIMLTLKEFELLLLFIRNKNVALYRDIIYENVWESEYMGESRTVDLHVQRLKKKLHWEDHIVAVYKVGYRLNVGEA